MEHSIIEAKITDIDEVLQLWLKLMDLHKEMDPSFFAEVEKNKNYYYKGLERYVNDQKSELFVLQRKGKITGFVTAEITVGGYPPYNSKEYCEIGDIIIDESFRANGFGKLLIEKVKTWAKGFDIDRIELSVIARNTSGYQFFKKVGFQDSIHRLYIDC